MTRHLKISICHSAVFLCVITLIVLFYYSTPGTATRDGYYEPQTVYFNRNNAFSLIDRSIIEATSSIDFTDYMVKSLYPHAKVLLNNEKPIMRCYVWKLKLLNRHSSNSEKYLQKLKPIDVLYTNYPFPKGAIYYEIPDIPDLIIAFDKSKYAYLIQNKVMP